MKDFEQGFSPEKPKEEHPQEIKPEEIEELSEKEEEIREEIKPAKEGILEKEILEKRGKRKEIKEFLINLEEAREDFSEAEAQLEKHRIAASVSQRLPFSQVIFERLGMPKDVIENYEKAKENYEKLQAEYGAEKAWRAVRERARLVDREISEREEISPGFGKRTRQVWDKYLASSKFGEWMSEKLQITDPRLQRVMKFLTGRTALSLGLLGVGAGGVMLGAGLPVGLGIGASALFARRVLAGVGAGIGFHKLMELGAEKLAKRRIKKIAPALKEFKEKKALSLDKSEIEQYLAEIEMYSAKKGENLIDNLDYLYLRQMYAKKIAEKHKNNLRDFVAKQNKDIIQEWKKAGRADLRRKLIAAGLGVFVGAGGIGWLWKETKEGFGWLKEFFEGKAVSPEIGPVPPTVEAPEKPFVEIPPTEEVPVVEKEISEEVEHIIQTHTEELEKAQLAVIKQGGCAWEAAGEFVDKGVITEAEFSEAWSDPGSMVKLPDGELVHISKLDLTHAGDQVELIKEADNTYRFNVIDYTKDKLRLGTKEDLARAFEHSDRPTPKWLEESVQQKEIVETPSPFPKDVISPEDAKTLEEAIMQAKPSATIEAPYPVEYWKGQDFETYLNEAVGRWKGKIVYHLTPEGGFYRNPKYFSGLYKWFHQRQEWHILNWIEKGRVSMVAIDRPGPFTEIKIVSANPLTPWTQSRLVPDVIFKSIPPAMPEGVEVI